jgi:ketosteroid isomerase-like protein
MTQLGKALDTAHANIAVARDGSSRGDDGRQIPITVDRVREIFKGLESGDGATFFDHVADDVDWTVMGTHPLAGHYLNKRALIAGTFAKLGQVLPNGAQLRTEHLIVKDDQAVVELHSFATAKDGMRFDNRYCWVVNFQNGLIARVLAYLDSAMVSRLFQENPIPDTESRNEKK